MSDLSPPRDPRLNAVIHPSVSSSAANLPNFSTAAESLTTQTSTTVTNAQINLPGTSTDALASAFRSIVPPIYSNSASAVDPLNLRNRPHIFAGKEVPQIRNAKKSESEFTEDSDVASEKNKKSVKSSKNKKKKAKKKRKTLSSSEDDSSSDSSSSSENSSPRRKRGYLIFKFFNSKEFSLGI